MPVTQNLKVRLLLKEAYDCVAIAADIAAEDVHAAAKLSEISRALDGLEAYLTPEAPLEPRVPDREALALSSHRAASASRNDLTSFRPSNYRPYLRSSVLVMANPSRRPRAL